MLLLSVELIPQFQLRDLYFKVAVLASDSKEFGCLARITTLFCTVPSSSSLPRRNMIKSDRANRFVNQGRRFACPQTSEFQPSLDPDKSQSFLTIISSDSFPINEGRKGLRSQEELLEKAGMLCREAVCHCKPSCIYIPALPRIHPWCKPGHKRSSNIDQSLNFLRARGAL